MEKIKRPKKYNKKLGLIAENYLAKGYSQRALVSHLKISLSTYNYWRKNHPEFDTHIENGIGRCEEFYMGKGLKLITGESKGSAQALFFFMKNILRWRDNIEGDTEKQPINITFNKLD